MARTGRVPLELLVSVLSCVVGCASLVGLEDKERPAGPAGAAGAAGGSAGGAGGSSGIAGAGGAGNAGAGTGGIGSGGAGTGGAGKGGAGTGGAGTGGAGKGGAGTGGAGKGGAGTGGAGTGGAGTGGVGAGGGGNGGAGTGGGPWLVFSMWDSDLQEMREPPVAYRMTLDGARQDLSALLQTSLGKSGNDDTVAVSRNGAFLVFTTTRGCDPDNECIVVARNDASLSDAFLVAVKEQFTTRRPHPWGRAAISDDGLRVVYSVRTTLDTWRLFTATRGDAESNVWSEEIPITTESAPVPYDSAPVFGPDPTRVLFACSPKIPVDSDESMSVCETGVVDGAGRVTLVDSTTLLGPSPAKNTAAHPSMRSDGFLFFTGEPSGGTSGRQVWVRKSPGNLSIVTDFAQDYDHSPCVLPDGRLASVWGKHPTFVHDVAIKIVPANLSQDSPTYLEALPAGIKPTQFMGPSLTCGGVP